MGKWSLEMTTRLFKVLITGCSFANNRKASSNLCSVDFLSYQSVDVAFTLFLLIPFISSRIWSGVSQVPSDIQRPLETLETDFL